MRFAASFLLAMVSTAAVAQPNCPPDRPHKRAVKDFTQVPACSLAVSCPKALICDESGEGCVYIPQRCEVCEPFSAVDECLSNREIEDAKPGRGPKGNHTPNGNGKGKQ